MCGRETQLANLLLSCEGCAAICHTNREPHYRAHEQGGGGWVGSDGAGVGCLGRCQGVGRFFLLGPFAVLSGKDPNDHK